MGIFTTCVFAQEVRGIETRRAIYIGEKYELNYSYNYRSYDFGSSVEYYGFEFTNLNSISVSVTIEVYEKGNPDKMIDTKEIVLKSQEKYIHKYPILRKFIHRSDYSYKTGDCWGNDVFSSSDNDAERWKKANERGQYNANNFYVKYKAFKLQ